MTETVVLLILFTLATSLFTLTTLLEVFAWRYKKTPDAMTVLLGRLPRFLLILYNHDNAQSRMMGCVAFLSNAVLACISFLMWLFLYLDVVILALMGEGTEQVIHISLALISPLIIGLAFYVPLHQAREYVQR